MAQRKTRFDRSRLNIGTYCIAEYAREDRHVREMKECGIDFLTAAPKDKNCLTTAKNTASGCRDRSYPRLVGRRRRKCRKIRRRRSA